MNGPETKFFQSEVKQLLELMIHSLYSKKEIFMRELLSNASDAIDKLRFLSISNQKLYEKDSNLRIKVLLDRSKSSIIIRDNGIGMNYQEVIENLGTIAKSGTKEFLRTITGSKKNINQLIGQFGVGFYSSFIVSKVVSVRTRSAGSKIGEGTLWVSQGHGKYQISKIKKLEKGTEVTLFLKEGEEEFLKEQKLQELIEKYSNHIAVPVELGKREQNGKNKIIWKRINRGEALWTRNKKDIGEEEYKEFYKTVFQDFNDPLIWSHNRVEGKQEYTSLLYIPMKAQLELWNRDKKSGFKLYVKRVFIMDCANQLLPDYLRFVKGLIDSNDFPLNISREFLQDSQSIKNLRNAIKKRILRMIEILSEESKDRYQEFWNQFGSILKEGLGEDPNNLKIITNLLRFSSTYGKDEKQTTSLKEYVDRMIDGQKKIYYITADNYLSARNSPHLELLTEKKVEVLLLFDRIDEWTMNYLTEYEGKSFQLVSKSNSSIEEISEECIMKDHQFQKFFESLLEKIKKYLGKRVKSVRFTNRLLRTPSVVTTDENEVTTQMAKLFSMTGKSVPKVRYTLEINPNHMLIKYLAKIDKSDLFEEWTELLLEQALLVENGTLPNLSKFIHRMNQLLLSSYSSERDPGEKQ